VDKNLNYNELARYVAGECSSREKAKIESRIEFDPEFSRSVEEVKKIWDTKMQHMQSWNVDKNWTSLNEIILKETENQLSRDFNRNRKNHIKQRKSSLAWGIWVAAIFVIAGTISLFGVIYFGDSTGEQSTVKKEVTTERGERAEVQLNDGTVVKLAPESHLIFAQEFDQHERSVHLSGEAYFEVTSDDDRPFYIFADEIVVQILGTSFVVKAYQEEDIQVVVASGKVNIGYKNSADELSHMVLLREGDLARFQHADKVLSVTNNVDLNRHLNWLAYRMVFDDATLAEVTRKLERWYGVDITLSDPGLEKLRLSATFEDDSIYEVLRIIQLALEVDYRMKNNHINIFFDESRNINRD